MNVKVEKALTPDLEISYETCGPADGHAVLLLHGWPYSLRCFDEVVGPLTEGGLRVIVPELRGFGETKYRDPSVMRTAQHSALGKDIIDLMDAIGLKTAVLAGYDWGGRAACVAAALWPERVSGLVTMQGYTIANLAKQAVEPPKTAQAIHNSWYRWVMQMKLGETILETMRDEFTRECWQTFSPKWAFSDEEFQAQAAAFQNPDWVATTLQQYRWWYSNAAGSPDLEPLEQKLAARPKIASPTIALIGDSDGMSPLSATKGQEEQYTGFYERRVLAGVGHCPAMEAPAETVKAIQDLCLR